jgi:6-phosphofructokinase 2
VALICRDLGVQLIVDTSGGGLRHITSGVYLLKASVRELRECVGRELATESEQLDAAHEIIDCGRAKVVVVSLGSDGALLATSQGSLRFPAIPMRALSGVGAGDAMVAAIAVGLSQDWSLSNSVRYGIAAGAAMLMTPGTQPCARADAERLFEVAEAPVEIRAARRGGLEEALISGGHSR